MPQKDPMVKRLRERKRYRMKREMRRAQIAAWEKAAHQRDPERVREKWRMYKAASRARAALRELEAVRAAKPTKAEPGYIGKLRPTGF